MLAGVTDMGERATSLSVPSSDLNTVRSLCLSIAQIEWIFLFVLL